VRVKSDFDSCVSLLVCVYIVLDFSFATFEEGYSVSEVKPPDQEPYVVREDLKTAQGR